MEQNQAPLWAALQQYKKEKNISFHMPGHKFGQGMDRDFYEELIAVCGFDVTEVPGTDDLHCPESCIKEAQILAAQAFGAAHSFFLVNGTSCGIQAMILAVCQPGDRILVPRNVHRSILGGLIMSGARPVYLQPEVSSEWGMALGLTPRTVQQALLRYPDVKALLLVSPTYYGVVSDLEEMIAIMHQAGKPVLVDEAHGAHLPFHPDLPTCALAVGADLSAQGAHKSLGAFTQAAFLHHQGNLVPLEKVQQVLPVLQTTSPSYLLMASLDTARRQMMIEGKGKLTHILQLVADTRKKINQLAGFYSFGLESIDRAGMKELDLTKLTVLTERSGLTGWAVDHLLRKHYGIQAELSTYQHLLFLCTIGTSAADLQALVQALQEIDQTGSLPPTLPYLAFLPELSCSPREAYFREKESVPLENALGRVSGEMIAPYPPGIPILAPGERITTEIKDYLLLLRETPQKVQGVSDHTLHTLVVLK